MQLSKDLYAVFKCSHEALSIEFDSMEGVFFISNIGYSGMATHNIWKGERMLKIRIQGTKSDIRWFIKILQADKRFCVENTSTFFDNFGTKKYKRVYTEIFRNKDK